jgi:protein-L-isoaspartate(D-aspartate) O-methyltransferase
MAFEEGVLERNNAMINYLLSIGYIDAKTANAMMNVPRELFVSPSDRDAAYFDHPLPIGYGQTISAPGIVGLMVSRLDIMKGMKVFEAGTGSGYQTAILAEMVGEEGEIVTIERVEGLVGLAKENIKSWEKCLGKKHKIKFLHGDGTKGYGKSAPYDRVSITAAAPSIPKPLIEQLKDDGKLIAPVGGAYYQSLVLYDKRTNEARNLLPVIFVPLIGEYGFGEQQ